VAPARAAPRRETVDGIIRTLMAINAELDRLVGWEEEKDSEEDGS
jgi:hypothetical protein